MLCIGIIDCVNRIDTLGYFDSLKGVKITSVYGDFSRPLKTALSPTPASSWREVTRSNQINAVTVLAPLSMRYEIIREALENGKHVFTGNPLVQTVSQAEEIIELAEKKRLKLMIENSFLFTKASIKIGKIIRSGTLGEINYYDSARINIGLFKQGLSLVWDLLSYDFAVMNSIVLDKPAAISGSRKTHSSSTKEAVVYVMVNFNNDMVAYFNINWLSPVKLITTLIGGAEKTLVWKDTEGDKKIIVCPRGYQTDYEGSPYCYEVDRIDTHHQTETDYLRLQVEYFMDLITENKPPLNDPASGLRTVRMLEACEESLQHNGKMIQI